MGHKELSAEIVRRSLANRWDGARLEWSLATVYFADEPQSCLCGHFPIIELCVLRNTRNRTEAVVGNHCVKKFLGLPSDKLFVAFKRIKKSDEGALNPEAIEYAHQRRWITDWERHFYFDTWRKRALTGRQLAKRVLINRKVLVAVARDTPRLLRP